MDSEAVYSAAVRQIEEQFELGSGFLARLRDEDDWSLVIKAHALVEAAVSQLLTHHVGDQRLTKVFDKLPLSDPQTGRLAFLKALNLLPEGPRRFLQNFSTLRNRLVHNVHNVRFRFVDDLATMDTNQRRAFADWVCWYAEPKARPAALENPRAHLFLAAMLFVSVSLYATNQAKYRHERIDRALDVLEASGLEAEDEEPNEEEEPNDGDS